MNLRGREYTYKMRIKDLFNPIGVSQSFSGLTVFLDQNNCKVVNKTMQDGAVLLHLQRELDGVEGHAYVRVKKDHADFKDQLLKWAFNEPKIIGLTINELINLETGLGFTSVDGRLQLGKTNR